jgi:hypothetical protein
MPFAIGERGEDAAFGGGHGVPILNPPVGTG